MAVLKKNRANRPLHYLPPQNLLPRTYHIKTSFTEHMQATASWSVTASTSAEQRNRPQHLMIQIYCLDNAANENAANENAASAKAVFIHQLLDVY